MIMNHLNRRLQMKIYVWPSLGTYQSLQTSTHKRENNTSIIVALQGFRDVMHKVLSYRTFPFHSSFKDNGRCLSGMYYGQLMSHDLAARLLSFSERHKVVNIAIVVAFLCSARHSATLLQNLPRCRPRYVYLS